MVAVAIGFYVATVIGQVATSAPPAKLSAQPPPPSGVVNRNRVLPPVVKAPLSPEMSNQLTASLSNNFFSSNQIGMISNQPQGSERLTPTGSAAGTNRSRQP
jgi:hypothetical protein